MQGAMTTKKPIHSRLPAALAATFLLASAACGLSEDAYVAKSDASADAAKGGAAGSHAGAGGGTGSATAGNFAGSGMSGTFGNGGAAGDDTADADAAVA